MNNRKQVETRFLELYNSGMSAVKALTKAEMEYFLRNDRPFDNIGSYEAARVKAHRWLRRLRPPPDLPGDWKERITQMPPESALQLVQEAVRKGQIRLPRDE